MKGGEGVKIIINANPKEIAALVLALQEQHKTNVSCGLMKIEDLDKVTHQIVKSLQEVL